MNLQVGHDYLRALVHNRQSISLDFGLMCVWVASNATVYVCVYIYIYIYTHIYACGVYLHPTGASAIVDGF